MWDLRFYTLRVFSAGKKRRLGKLCQVCRLFRGKKFYFTCTRRQDSSLKTAKLNFEGNINRIGRLTLSLREYFLLGVTAFLGVASASILWRLLTVKYPTHWDVFFMGVEAGALAILLLVCLSLISYLLHRLAVLSSKKLKPI